MEAEPAREEFARGYIGELSRVLDGLPWREIDRVLGLLEQAYDGGRQVFIAGNGGSAATASHMANDLMLGVAKDGSPGFRVIALTDNVAAMTAIANDEGYDYVFAGQLRTLAQAGDVLVVVTGSGNSPNIVHAARFARDKGMTVIGFLGRGGGEALAMCDAAVVVPSSDYGPIEDTHMVLDHLITAYFRRRAARRP